jgi:hypothetical protein
MLEAISPLLGMLLQHLGKTQVPPQPPSGAWNFVKKQTTPSPDTSTALEIEKQDSADGGGP